MVCASLTKCPWSRGGIMLLQWSKGRPWSRIVYSNNPLWESLLACCSLCHNLSLHGTAHQTFPSLPLLLSHSSSRGWKAYKGVRSLIPSENDPFYSNHNIKIKSVLKLALFPAALWISHIFATIPINSCALLDSMLNGSWQRQLHTLCLL